GFGCPNNYQCHRHCKSIPGRCGGYCGGWHRLRCTCYRCG
nr:Chain A, DEFENSIN MGD-1 [synthetic construct]